MKRTVLVLLLLTAALLCKSQGALPINQLPTQTTKPTTAWIPMDIPSGNSYISKKISIASLFSNAMDSIFVRHDSLFGRKNNQLFFGGKIVSQVNNLLSYLTSIKNLSIDTINGNNYKKLIKSDLINNPPTQVFIDGLLFEKAETLSELYIDKSTVAQKYYYDAVTGSIYTANWVFDDCTIKIFYYNNNQQ